METATVTSPKTAEIVEAMLKANTGSQLCDSGRAYGYQYERNAKRDLRKEPSIKLEFNPKFKEISIYMKLFHALDDNLNYDHDWQRLFDEFITTDDQKDEPWPENLDAFFKVDQGAYQAAGRCLEIYKDDEDYVEWLTNFRKQMADGCEFKVEYGGYTYNDETLVDQDFCYWKFRFDGDDFTIIQSHNGCDARGGFSPPKFFGDGLDELLCNISYDSAYIRCEGYESHQLLFNGQEEGHIQHSWSGSELNDESYPHNAKGLYEYPMEFGNEWKKGVLVVDADKAGAWCPECPSRLS